MPTEEELEQLISEAIDREEAESRVLSLNIENKKEEKAVEV